VCYLTTLSVSRLYSVDDGMIDEHGAAGGMRTGKGNWSTWRKSVPVPLHSPKILHDLTLDRTRAASCWKPTTSEPLKYNDINNWAYEYFWISARFVFSVCSDLWNRYINSAWYKDGVRRQYNHHILFSFCLIGNALLLKRSQWMLPTTW
jgi:hypothetical protein